MGGESDTPESVDILILGAGWTSRFLIPLLDQQRLTYAATSTTGRPGTIKFKFEYDAATGKSDSSEQYARLPHATTVLIVFPLRGPGQAKHLVETYRQTHTRSSMKARPHFIQLGSSGIWDMPGHSTWVTRCSPYDKTDVRAVAEDELLALGSATVLNLSGLWGMQRNVKHWLDRVAPTKQALGARKSLHMVHGLDVARAIVAVHTHFEKAAGQRWMLTDLNVYDWWALVLGFAGEKVDVSTDESRARDQVTWVGELMREHDIRALPRSPEELTRCYDTLDFWTTFKLMPLRAGLRADD